MSAKFSEAAGPFCLPNIPDEKCIVFIGMAGAGKTTVGRMVARSLGWAFADSDHIIEAAYGAPLQDITDALGKEAFIDLEAEIVGSLRFQRTVIATGGSAVYSEAAMAHFKSVGTVVYLRLSFETVEKRLGNFTHRGVVMPEGYTLRDLYDERCALYEQYADITVDESRGDSIGDVLDSLCVHFECD